MNEYELETKRSVYIDYLKVKIDEQDWHAVWDVAVELYLIDFQLKKNAVL